MILAVLALAATNLRATLTGGPDWLLPQGTAGGQVIQAAGQYARQHPDLEVLVSPDTNPAADVFRQFYGTDLANLRLGGSQEFAYAEQDNLAKTAFLAPHGEYQQAIESGKFSGAVLAHLAAAQPAGGYDLFTLAYSPHFADVLATEQASWHILTWETLSVAGAGAQVGHSGLDLGAIGDLFDGDTNSLARTAFANPFVIDLRFDQPRSLTGLRVRVGSEPVTLAAQVSQSGRPQALTFSAHGEEVPDYKEVGLSFGETLQVNEVRIEILDDNKPEPDHVHAWEVWLDGQP